PGSASVADCSRLMWTMSIELRIDRSCSMTTAQRSELAASPTFDQRRTYRIRTVAYWILTLLVTYEMVAGSLWVLLQLEYPRAVRKQIDAAMSIALRINRS